MDLKRPATISLKNLSSAVEQAAKTATEKNQAQFSPGLHIGPTILGKIIRPPVKEFAQAEKLAAEITQHVSAGGGPLAASHGQLQPAVLATGGHII